MLTIVFQPPKEDVVWPTHLVYENVSSRWPVLLGNEHLQAQHSHPAQKGHAAVTTAEPKNFNMHLVRGSRLRVLEALDEKTEAWRPLSYSARIYPSCGGN